MFFMGLDMLRQIIAPTKFLVTYMASKWSFIGMNGSYMPFQMLASLKALGANVTVERFLLKFLCRFHHDT